RSNTKVCISCVASCSSWIQNSDCNLLSLLFQPFAACGAEIEKVADATVGRRLWGKSIRTQSVIEQNNRVNRFVNGFGTNLATECGGRQIDFHIGIDEMQRRSQAVDFDIGGEQFT